MFDADHFVAHFRQPGEPMARGNFLSRIFGIFSEEIVRIWCRDDRSPYENLGRPTLHYEGKPYTLDFLFRSRATGRVFVVEQKCEIAFENYRYLTLSDVAQLAHHKKAAFAGFLAAAYERTRPPIFHRREPIETDGAILIWGALDRQNVRTIQEATGLSDIISLSDVIQDLRTWRSDEYLQLVEDRRQWSAGLFAYLSEEA